VGNVYRLALRGAMDPVTAKIRDIMGVLETNLPNAWTSTILKNRPGEAGLLTEGVRILRSSESKLDSHDITKLLNGLLHIFRNERPDDGAALKSVKLHFMALALLRLVQSQLTHIVTIAPICTFKPRVLNIIRS
jgi:hypothetical protein